MNSPLNCSQINIFELLELSNRNPFRIPMYQRAYVWDEETAETLFNDIAEFTHEHMEIDSDALYFLGNIVTYRNKNEEYEIIDGQQRITTLYLLLSCIYHNKENFNQAIPHDIISRIRSVLSFCNDLYPNTEVDPKLMTVIGRDDYECFHRLITTGEHDINAKDNYSKNYIRFAKLLMETSNDEPDFIKHFANNLLFRTTVLHITTNDTIFALTIFDTLNNRGTPLSPTDVFKVKLYNQCEDEQTKEKFVNVWSRIEHEIAQYDLGIDFESLFKCQMFFQKAIEKDRSTSMRGIKSYFLSNPDRLSLRPFMRYLSKQKELWRLACADTELFDEEIYPIQKSISILQSFPNDLWRYPVVTYYLSHKEKCLDYGLDFAKYFLLFLRKLISFLLIRYVDNSSKIKSSILKLDIEITKGLLPQFDAIDVDEDTIYEELVAEERISGLVLKTIAFESDDIGFMVDSPYEVEHIIPQKYKKNWKQIVKANQILIPHIGNKLLLEKELNVTASNLKFEEKLKAYQKSELQFVKLFVANHNSSWNCEDVLIRDKELINKLFEILHTWDFDYDKALAQENN